MKILIVDDSPAFVEATTDSLVARGYEVASVDSWLEVAPALRREQPDALLVDINLPGLTGDVVARTVRRFYTGPIVFVSSEPEERLKQACAGVERSDYLRKDAMLRALLPIKLVTLMRQGAPGAGRTTP